MRRYLANGFLLATSILVSVGLAEAAVRIVDWLQPRWMMLDTRGTNTTSAHLDEIPRATGVARDLFFSDPPPLKRTAPPREWVELDRQLLDINNDPTRQFKQWDMFKAWNAVFVGDPCKNSFLRGAPGRLFVYDPPNGEPRPPNRYLPNTTTPMGLTTNAFGWRGRPVPFQRSPNTVRIVFVGASTTSEPHGYPYSGPEYIDNWLNRWAAEKGLGVRFEVLNAGRESLSSTDIAAVVRQEVALMRPDLVVYYEGNNQLHVVKNVPSGVPRPNGLIANWLRDLSPYLKLAQRAQSLIEADEWSKPAYEISWPAGLDESNPDITRQDLPLNLNIILGNFDAMRHDLTKVGSEFAISSFHWLAKNGLILNGFRHEPILEDLNLRWFPFHYGDLERMTSFENHVFAKYAAVHGLPFVDVARYMPYDPDLFSDATHNTPFGVRLRAWIVMQQLVPMIEKRLASGAWPKPVPAMGDAHPAFKNPPRQIRFKCESM
jgi:hypothetical protein